MKQKKERELAAKLVRRAEILKEREDIAANEKALKLPARDAEKVRRAGLTPSARKAEDLHKKQHLAVERAAKQRHEGENLARARALLS